MPQEVAFPSENGLARGFLNSTRTSARNVSLYSLLSSFSSSPFSLPKATFRALPFFNPSFTHLSHPFSVSPFASLSLRLSVSLFCCRWFTWKNHEREKNIASWLIRWCIYSSQLSYILSALGRDTHLFSLTESIKFDTWLSPSSRVCCLRYHVHRGYCSSILKYLYCLPKLLTTTQRKFFDDNFVNFEVHARSIPLDLP